MTGLTHELVGAVVILLLYGGVFIGAELAHSRFRLHPEVTRKIAHVAGGLIALALPYIFDSYWTVVILGALFALTLTVTRRRKMIRSVHEVRRSTHGEIYFPAALALTFLACSLTGTFRFYPVAILALTFGDTAAWYVGSRFGSLTYTIFGDTKSWEGTGAIALTTAAIVLGTSLEWGSMELANRLALASGAGILAALLEAFSPKGTDNLTIPLGVWGLLWTTVGT